ncbi:uncharacterized protein LOC135155515 [Lytechinus pictus]|uniref:uncharacterized protein LOC135155515 n=1 Tax=Lytechinus pictus TaxID=7653 RepID=UPI0030B9F579
MTAAMERNCDILNELDKEHGEQNDFENQLNSSKDGPGSPELTIPAEQTKLDAVRRVSTGMYLTASEALGYGMGSVKRAASGIGAGITRAGQNVADKMQKSPKIPKAMRKRAEVDDLSMNMISDDSDDGLDDDEMLMMPKKSSKEALVRKKRMDSKKKESKQTW